MPHSVVDDEALRFETPTPLAEAAAVELCSEPRRCGAPSDVLPTRTSSVPSLDVLPRCDMARLMSTIDIVGPRSVPVLVTGETGVGKELVANRLHLVSGRRGPIRVVNCAAIPPLLTESLLFGYERGSFTGADSRTTGLFESANHGTLFLDEIGELDPRAQASLLRVLNDLRVVRIGAMSELKLDVRIVAATNRNLDELVARGRFRDDLLYRINTVTVHVPPLRARRSEVEQLALLFLGEAAKRFGAEARRFAPAALDVLKAYDWPGNVRQLRNVVEGAVAICVGQEIEVAHFPDSIRCARSFSTLRPEGALDSRPSHACFREKVAEFERGLINEAMAETRGSVSRAADLLGIPIRTLSYKLKFYRFR
jgi:DNA-binding NtrC family response regulator